MRLVCEPRDRNTKRRVEDREGEAAEQAHLRIADVQIAANRLDQQRQDLPIDERAGVREREHDDHEPRVDRVEPGRNAFNCRRRHRRVRC
jgi:hypothetical protein